MDIILNMDLISDQVAFSINKSYRYRNCIGLLCTLSSVVFIIYIFMIGCVEVIYKENPTIRQSQEFVVPSLSLNKTNVPIVVSIGGGNGPIANTTYIKQFLNFTPYMSVGSVINTTSGVKRTVVYPLSWVPCDESYFGAYKDIFIAQMAGNLSGYMCIDTTNVTLLSTNAIAPCVTLELYFAICDRSNKSNGCLEPNSLTQRWTRLVTQIYFLDTYVDVNNQTNPIQNYVNVKFFWFSSSNYKRYYFNYDPESVITDDGWIQSVSKQIDSYQWSPVLNNDLMDINADDPLVKFRLSVSLNNVKRVYYRSYKKIQDVFGNVGGLYRALMILSYIGSYIFRTNYKYNSLWEAYSNSLPAVDVDNSRFNLGDLHNSRISLFGQKEVNQKIKLTGSTPVRPMMDVRRANLGSKVGQGDTPSKRRDQVNWIDKFTMNFQCNKNKRKFFGIIHDKMREVTSLEYLFKAFVDIDILKSNITKLDNTSLDMLNVQKQEVDNEVNMINDPDIFKLDVNDIAKGASRRNKVSKVQVSKNYKGEV